VTHRNWEFILAVLKIADNRSLMIMMMVAYIRSLVIELRRNRYPILSKVLEATSSSRFKDNPQYLNIKRSNNQTSYTTFPSDKKEAVYHLNRKTSLDLLQLIHQQVDLTRIRMVVFTAIRVREAEHRTINSLLKSEQ